MCFAVHTLIVPKAFHLVKRFVSWGLEKVDFTGVSAVFGLSSVCIRMHVRVRMCLRAWACDVVSMVVSGVWCSRNRLGIRVGGMREG